MILRAGSVAAEHVAGSAPRIEERFGDAAGMTGMGVNVVTLAPGERSAQKHWHSHSDEFVLVLEGTATVIEDECATEIGPGDMAIWPAGVTVAHQVVNQGETPLRYLCAGTNPPAETVRYPDEGETLFLVHPDWHVIGDDGTIRRSGRE
ncbi:cupin domain-containing protein [Paracoccus aurantiacus]|nr:cupin domain-containing protein [Paracoccus aurantiacus]